MHELKVFETRQPLQEEVDRARSHGRRIALVPTMGNLHAGHLKLVEKAREQAGFVVASIFVNPLQFGPNEDFARYPRTLDADLAALRGAGCDAVFLPSVATMYPQGMAVHTTISVPQISTLHCGASRPGHFDGVCTVVCKLFRLVRPDLAVFGLKDYQQFRIISRMVEDLLLDVELLGVPTVREDSGLALSSRNGYLSAEQRQLALALWRNLQAAAAAIRGGRRDFAALEAQAMAALASAGLEPDYFHICDRESLLPAAADDAAPVILAAARVGTTRLIDNILV
jgi:pantoate--beta-alanine ligase